MVTIAIDDSPQAVMEVLWVREAFALHPIGDLPPLLVDTPPASGPSPTAKEWEDTWPELWNTVIDHAAQLTYDSLIERLQGTALGPLERAELLKRLSGTTWRDRFGDTAFDDSYRSWSERRFRQSRRNLPRSGDVSPEHASLRALIPAWEAGLAKIITIPCRGEYTRVISNSALLMTEATRNQPELYTAALETFR